MATPLRLVQPAVLIDSLERIRLTHAFAMEEWSELLCLTPQEYAAVRRGQIFVPELALEKVSERIGVKREELESGRLDFRELAIRNQPLRKVPGGIGERYFKG